MIKNEKNNDSPVSWASLKVVLLSLNWYRRKDPRIPLGMAYIYSEIKNRFQGLGFKEVSFIEADVRDNLSNVIHEILTVNPLVLGIGVYAWNSEQTRKIVNSLRKLGFSGKIVLGGPEITYGGNELNEEFTGIQYFVKGFGEKAFADILESLIHKSDYLIKGVYKHGSEIGNILAEASMDLNSSPFLQEELLDKISGKDFIRWQTQRGCVFICSFCAFKLPNGGIAESDMETVKLELLKLKEMGIKNVAVLDPVFFLFKKRSLRILKIIEAMTPKVRFNIQTRFEHLDSEIIIRLSRLNIVLECGLQTLDPKVQRKIKRINNKEKVIAAMYALKDSHVKFETHLIYGLPEQTFESFLSDLLFLYDMGCQTVRIFPLSRLKGTEIDVEKESNGIVFSPVFPNEVIKSDWMTIEEVFVLKRIQRMLEDNENVFSESILKPIESIRVN